MHGTARPSVVIPDLHGCSHALEWVTATFRDRSLVFLGDLVHRGPDSRRCMKTALALAESGRAILLWGNHEAWIRDEGLGLDAEARAAWFRANEAELLREYRAADEDVHALIRDFERFADVARPYLVEADMLCAHAARPSFGRDADDLLDVGYLWDRPELGLHPLPTHLFPGLRYSVHGHAPVNDPIVDLGGEGVVYLDLGTWRTGRFCVWDAESKQVVSLGDAL